MPVVTVGESAGAMVALALVVLLAWFVGDHGRRAARPSPEWAPAAVTATYREAESVCRLLRRQGVVCRLMPAVERLHVDAAAGVVALVPATQMVHATAVVSGQLPAADRFRGQHNPPE